MEQSVLNLELLVASAKGNFDEVCRLATEGADVNFKDSNGNTCLHLAANAKSHSQEVASRLIRSGARTNVENNKYETALDVAFEAKNIAVMDLIEREMLKETEKLCNENEKIQEERSAYVRPSAGKSIGLYESTLKRKYQYEYTDKEIDSLLNFLWAPLDTAGSDKVKLCITFHIGLGKESIHLIWPAADLEPSFAKSWGTACVENSKLKQNNWIEFCCWCHDPVTYALARALDLGECISKLWKTNSAQIVTETEIQRFMTSLENWSESKSQEWRSFFACVLNEINRTLNKAKKCIDFFRSCSNDLSDEKCSLEYRMANSIIYFIETFALQDTHCEISMTNNYENSLKKRKKAYFKRIYNSIFSNSSGINVLSTFSTMRENILKKSGCFQVSLQTIECFITDTLNLKLKEFFAAMTDFAERVVQNQERNMHNALQDGSLNVFKVLKQKAVQFLSGERIETLTGVSDSIRRFSMNVDKLEREPHRFQSVVFDLLVNVFPRLDLEKSPLKCRLSRLRNDIIHNFQKLTPTKVSQDLPSAINDMYRFELALHMHEAMTVFRHDQDIPGLHKDLSHIMNSIGEHYVNLNLYAGTENGNFLSDAYDSSWMRKELRKIVQTYVNCLAPILDRDGNTDDDIVCSLPHLSNFQKREILEKFWSLREHYRDNKDVDENSKKLLQSELQSHLGLNEREAQSALKNGIIINNANIMLEDKILGEVEGIFTNLTLHNKKDFSSYDVIALLEGLINGTSSYMPRNVGQFDTISMDKASIGERLQLVVTNEDEIKLKWGEDGQCVNVTLSSIILNILKILNEVQQVYQLKFETVSAAFEDPVFVSYLVEREVKEVQQGGGAFHYLVKDRFRICKQAAQLLHIKFIAPFLCAVLLKTRDFYIFDNSSLRVLLECMLQDQINHSYVEALIALKNERVTNEMFSIILDQNVSNHKAMFVFIEITMQRNLQSCVKSAEIKHGKDGLIDIQRKLVSLANGAVLEKINLGKLDDAETLLNEVQWCLADFPATSTLRASPLTSTRRHSLPSPGSYIPLTTTHKIIHEKADIFSSLNLLTAKLLNARGTRLCKPWEKSPNCEGRKFFERARKTLQKVLRSCKDDDLNVKNYMLALARSAYTVELLVKCRGWEYPDNIVLYEEALTNCEKSWNVLWRAVMLSTEPPPTDYTSFFHRVRGSKRYSELMQDREFWKYMNVLKILRNIARFTGRLGAISKTPKLIEKSLKILQQTSDLHANETNSYAALIRSIIQKDRAIQYKSLNFYSNGTKFDQRFYQLKCLELTLMHYSSGLGFYGRDYRHIELCSKVAGKMKMYLLKSKAFS